MSFKSLSKSSFFQYTSVFVFAVCLLIIYDAINQTTITLHSYLNISINLVLMIAFFYLINIFFRALGLQPIPFFKKPILQNCLVSFLFMTLILLVHAVVFQMTNKSINYFSFSTSYDLLVGSSSNIQDIYPTFFTFFLFMVITAFIEELVFRGILLEFFIQKNKKYFGLFFISSLFGLVHLTSYIINGSLSMNTLVPILLVMVGGLILGLSYIQFGLFGAIIVHTLWNTIGSALYEQHLKSGIILIIFCGILFLIMENKIRLKGKKIFKA